MIVMILGGFRGAGTALAVGTVLATAVGCSSGRQNPTASTGSSTSAGTTGAGTAPFPSVPSSPPSTSVTSAGRQPGPAPTRSGSPSSTTSGRVSGGWTATVYYTAVEDYHSGRAVRVTGCPTLECSRGHADLGSYPADFVSAVRDEGTGRTASGRYLNWSYDTGYWLDSAPRDSTGRALRPFESAAADPGVLARGTRFVVLACGEDEGGDPVDPAVCARLRQVRWTVTDEFTPGLGGAHHIDLYIGEETGRGFTGGPWYTTLVGARLRIG